MLHHAVPELTVKIVLNRWFKVGKRGGQEIHVWGMRVTGLFLIACVIPTIGDYLYYCTKYEKNELVIFRDGCQEEVL
jgi:hypothetical protein